MALAGQGGVTSSVPIFTRTLWYGNFFDFYKFYKKMKKGRGKKQKRVLGSDEYTPSPGCSPPYQELNNNTHLPQILTVIEPPQK
jgi:hypothetical protein